MATEVIIPALGVVVERVKILKWLKSEGDRVAEGEPLVEIESEKVTTEITSPASGIITEVAAVVVAEGEAVPESYREKVREAAAPSAPAPAPSVLVAEKAPKPVRAAPAARKLAERKGVDISLVSPTGPHGTIMKKDVEAYLASAVQEERPRKVSTLARKEAERLGVSLEGIQGTGIRGRVMKADVIGATEHAEAAAEEEDLFGKVIPMNRMRQIIARRMSESAFTAPHIYFFTDVNMDKMLDLREGILEDFERRFHVRPSINDFLVKAVALAIREYPLLNATVKGDEIHVHPEIKMRADLVDRAREGKLTIEEVERGTFTVSSLASFDITSFTAILNPPQSGILTVGKTQEQVYLEDGAVKARKVSTYGLSVDHRIIDGAVAAQFLQAIKRIMENPHFSFLQL
jgi:pyruvate dehydrogenase E2 component (dihydrolipoamide acetyltransferase)